MGAAFDTDIVIVGAGPVGLATACALAHHGVWLRQTNVAATRKG